MFPYIFYAIDFLVSKLYICRSVNISMVNKSIKELIPKIQAYLVTKPVTQAWLFGSCSRGEETPDSDIDLLVSYDKDAHVGLFTISGMYIDLKNMLNREIDLVEEGTLLPFAVESAEHDKILIYERAD
jgi:predicted nucleotidyltransferase